MSSRSRSARRCRREAQRRQAKAARTVRRIISASPAYRPLTWAEMGDHPLSAISAAVLVTIRKDFYRESASEFAGRAGVTPAVIRDAESGTWPAWALSRRNFNAIVDAITAQTETSLAELFDQAAAIDFVLSCLVTARAGPGIGLAIAASLLQDRRDDRSWSLVYWALESLPQERYTATSSLHVLKLPIGPLVTGEHRARLRHAAAVLATVDVPAAHIGEELLEMLDD